MLLTLLLAAGAVSCSKQDAEGLAVERETKGEHAGSGSLALSVSSGNEPVTKMLDNITQSANAGGANPTAFRGLQDIHIFPFTRRGENNAVSSPVVGSDAVNKGEVALPHNAIAGQLGSTLNNGLVNNNYGHLFERVEIPHNTASVTVYAKALEETAEPTEAAALRTHRKRYGALMDTISEDVKVASDVTFSPVPILGSLGNEMNTLLYILNQFMGISGSNKYYYITGRTLFFFYNWSSEQTLTVRWDGASGNADLDNIFNIFTNNGAVFSASTASVEHLLTQLYQSLQAFTVSGDYTVAEAWNDDKHAYLDKDHRGNSSYYLTYDAIYGSGNNALKKKLLDKFTSLSRDEGLLSINGSGTSATISLAGSLANFPASYGIPEGSMGLLWSNGSFQVANENNGTRLVPAEDYCYPPSLWYHTNSTLSVTNEEGSMGQYYTESNNWSGILQNYASGKVVFTAARAAAVDKPLQYGPALFTFSFSSTTASSLAANDKSVPVSNGSFPVTGIVIGDQRKQSFQFHPLPGKIQYLWDDAVLSNGNSGTPKAYIKGSQQPISTLVLETEETENIDNQEANAAVDVHYAIEFLNNSGTSFLGATGNILPGTKFYLIGILSLNDVGSHPIKSIFKQDCQTQAVFRVDHLRNAYNTVPDLRNPQLEIGVSVQLDWMLNTPTELALY